MSKLIKSMVFFTIISATVALFDDSIIPPEIRKLLKGLHDICVQKTSTDEALIERLKQADFSIENQNVKCYIKCLLTQSGAMDGGGHVDIEAAVALIPEQIKDAVIRDVNQCAKNSEQIAEYCDRAYSTLKCLYDVNPDIYYVF